MTTPPPKHRPAGQKTQPKSRQYVTETMRAMAFLIHDEPNTHGDSQTKGEALAASLWRDALGWEEEKRDDDGHLQRIWHPPILAMKKELLDRLDGKALPLAEAQGSVLRASEKVGELAKGRLNKLAEKAQQE